MQAIRQADGSIDYDHYRMEAVRLRQQAKSDAVTAAMLWVKRGFFSLLRPATGSVRRRYGTLLRRGKKAYPA